jgi:DNA repair exonuclease SbcCD ATPase subunit
MRKLVTALSGLLVLLAIPVMAQSQQPDIVEAARRAREQKKTAPKAKIVWTNDNIPRSGGRISTSTGVESAVAGVAADAAAVEKEEKLDEADWRKKFTDLRQQIANAEKELDLLKREFNLNQIQFYSDPNKALREQYARTELNEGKLRIDAKTQEIAQLKQKLADLEDELRRKGGPPAWARP